MTDHPFDAAWVADRLDHVLAAVRHDADGVEARFRGEEASHLRLAESAIIQAASVVEGRVTVRAVVDGREARATTTNLTDDGLARCARHAVERARQAPVPAEPVELPQPQALVSAGERALDEATARLDAATKGRWLADALQAHTADDLALAGRFHSGMATFGVRSTVGVDAYHQGTWAELSLSALERPAGHRASAYRAMADTSVNQATVERLQEEVRAECHRAHDPVQVDLGAWDVVLAPAAVAELMEWMSLIAFSSSSLEEGLSFVGQRRGEQVTGDAISISDDASMSLGLGIPLPFDCEGQPKRRVALIERGIARDVVHDTRSGRRHGCASTGHAQHSDEFPAEGSHANHLHVEPGTSTVDELVERVDRGLLITRLHYVNGMLEPRRAVMTGLLRDGAFLIESGRLTRAVQPMRFTDSILEAFGRIPGRDGISSTLESHNGWFGPDQCFVAPWLLVPGLRFTSGR